MVDDPWPTQAQADAFKLQAHGVTVELPANVDAPAVTGTGTVGETLTVTMGNWTGEPTNYAYQWQRDGMGGLQGSESYVVVDADVGHSITCVVTATNAAGSTEAAPSNAIAVAAAGTEAAAPEVAARDMQPGARGRYQTR
jgi:hypothetical protein